MDGLERWAETVGSDKGPRDWVPIDDPELVAVFGRVYSEVRGRPHEPELLQIQTAEGAVRVKYAGGVIIAKPRDDDVCDDLPATIASMAFTLADNERSNERH